jgi:hypothetical protein
VEIEKAKNGYIVRYFYGDVRRVGEENYSKVYERIIDVTCDVRDFLEDD